MINKNIVKYSFITLLLNFLIQAIGSVLFVIKFPDFSADQIYSAPYIFYLIGIPFFANISMGFFVKDWTTEYKKVLFIVFLIQCFLDITLSFDKEISLHLMNFSFYFTGFYFGTLFNSFYKKI